MASTNPAPEPDETPKEPLNSDEIHHKSKIMKVPLAQLKVDRSYQRPITQGLLDYLVREYDVIAAELILVSNRGERPEDGKVEGGMFIVSGQHRARAQQVRGEKFVDARVIDLTEAEDPAEIEAYYRTLANRRAPDRAIDTFRAKVRQGDPDSVGLVKLLGQVHTHVNEIPGQEDGIDAIGALESIYARDEGSTLKETLEILNQAWGPLTPRVASADLMKGIAWFIGHHSTEADHGRLIEKMKTVTVPHVKARAQQSKGIQGKSLWVNVYLIIVELYNEKLTQARRLEINLKGWGVTQRDQSGAKWRREKKAH
jgi:hypothetical protein